VDETGQPDGPPPGANGNGHGDRGDSRLHGWARALAGQSVSEDGSGSPRGSSWADAGSALESPSEPLSGWRAPDPVALYGHRYADLLTPLSPPPPGAPAPPPVDVDAALDEPGTPPVEYEPWSPAPAPTTPGPVPQQYAVPPLPPQHVPAGLPPPPPLPGDPPPYGVTPHSGLPTYTRPVNGSTYPETYTETYAERPERAEPADDLDAGPEPGVRSGPEDLPFRAAGLPQRVPAEPDVPTLPEPMTEEADERAEVPELARIATYLRHQEVAARPVRESLDVDAVLAAVRGVYGVRDAELRTNPGGVHSLRLDLADGADPGQVSREVARLLKDRLGLAAALGSRMGAPDRSPVRVGDGIYQGRRRVGTGAARGRATVEPATDGGGSLVPDGPRPDTFAGEVGRAGAGDPTADRPLPRTAAGLRIILDHVQVSTFGLDATVEVRLALGGRRSIGEAQGPAVDGYVLRLAAAAAANALDRLLVAENTGASRGRCFVEHASVVPFGTCEVAVVVILLVCGGWVEQLAGSALVAGDPKQAMVRATLSAVNRRMESLLP
jgi:hypothetical protein